MTAPPRSVYREAPRPAASTRPSPTARPRRSAAAPPRRVCAARSRPARRSWLIADRVRRRPCRGSCAAAHAPTACRSNSGWNCTPSTGSSRWRTPMIRSSSLQAVTSSTSGSPSREMTSEWYRVAGKGLSRPRRHPVATVVDGTDLAVHHVRRADDGRPVRDADRLMAEADAEDRDTTADHRAPAPRRCPPPPASSVPAR